MIRAVTDDGLAYNIVPTMFPDGTSQVWKLPEDLVKSRILEVTWNFENEREVIDLLSLRKIQRGQWYLHIPFLPYGRQDKEASNTSTFNLRVFADLVNLLDCAEVTSVDSHNPEVTGQLIKNFTNVPVTALHKLIVDETQPDYLVYPDLGAKNRYYTSDFSSIPRVIFYKERDQLTGQIVGHTLSYRDAQGITIQGADMGKIAKPGQRFLIVDDLCDGGATFISIARKLREQVPGIEIDLFVTHGVFSK